MREFLMKLVYIAIAVGLLVSGSIIFLFAMCIDGVEFH